MSGLPGFLRPSPCAARLRYSLGFGPVL